MEKIIEIIRIKQVREELTDDRFVVRSPKDAYECAQKHIGDDDREVFFVMCLNTKNEVIAIHRAHVGSLNASVVHPRDVFKSAILNNSASIIVSHQHPSGNPQESQEDVHVTKRLAEAGKMIGIEVLDHIIVGDNTFVSLKEKGFIN